MSTTSTPPIAPRGGVLLAARAGAMAALPAAIFILPFGAFSGVLAAEAGLSLPLAMALSVLVFAGASQLVALELLVAGAPLAILVLSCLAVNLRFLMYSAAIAPHLAGEPARRKLWVAYFNVDNGIGSFLAWRGLAAAAPAERSAFLIGCGAASWLIWQSGTIAGHQLGAGLLRAEKLEVIAPIAFLALAAPLLTSAPRWTAAAVAAVGAVALRDAPYQTGAIIAALVGVATALLFPVPPEEASETENRS